MTTVGAIVAIGVGIVSILVGLTTAYKNLQGFIHRENVETRRKTSEVGEQLEKKLEQLDKERL